MKTSEATTMRETNLPQNFFPTLREKLAGRNGLIAAAVLIIGDGMILNWDWLTVAGLAPLILGILPCAAMCALGLCANKMMGGKSSCSGSETLPKTADATDSPKTGATRQNAADPDRARGHDGTPGKYAA